MFDNSKYFLFGRYLKNLSIGNFVISLSSSIETCRHWLIDWLISLILQELSVFRVLHISLISYWYLNLKGDNFLNSDGIWEMLEEGRYFSVLFKSPLKYQGIDVIDRLIDWFSLGWNDFWSFRYAGLFFPRNLSFSRNGTDALYVLYWHISIQKLKIWPSFFSSFFIYYRYFKFFCSFFMLASSLFRIILLFQVSTPTHLWPAPVPVRPRISRAFLPRPGAINPSNSGRASHRPSPSPRRSTLRPWSRRGPSPCPRTTSRTPGWR